MTKSAKSEQNFEYHICMQLW